MVGKTAGALAQIKIEHQVILVVMVVFIVTQLQWEEKSNST